MTSIRRFSALDLFRFNNVNLDPLTETYNISFYLQYLARWPDMFHVAVAPNNRLMGYMMGKVEGQGMNWHGHVTALTVAPEYRRLGLARRLMDFLEETSEKVYNGYFVDLFVRKSNDLAINMYKKLGYVVYRRVIGYYATHNGNDEDAYDMRKSLARDRDRISMIPLKRPVYPEDL